MTEADYFALTAACDRLLLAPNATPERIAIPLLHVLSEHPNNYWQYEAIFEKRPFKAMARRARYAAGSARTVARSLLQPGIRPDQALEGRMKCVDVLFVSHLVAPGKFDADSTDFYYGDLASQLAARGFSSLTVLLNHTLEPLQGPAQAVSEKRRVGRFVLPFWSTYPEEAELVRRARAAASALHGDAYRASNPLEREVALQARRYAVTGTAITALRLHNTVRRLCARYKPRAVFVTWEGHSWERLVFHGARAANPAVRCIGYQHTILFPRSHALKRSLGAVYDPDVVITLGDVNRGVLAACEGFRGVPVLTYGSHRRASAPRQREPDASRRCVVIPEGLELECLTLFNFAIGAAGHLPELEFVLRTHPVLPYAELARKHPRLRSLPPNVHVSSERDINADFARCDWALYRGTSASVHAVLAGVRPVYVDRPDTLRIDPLFALQGWRRHIADVDGLRELITSDRGTQSNERYAEWEPARMFCESYVVAPRPEVVYEILAS
jgi:hypothetical protein